METNSVEKISLPVAAKILGISYERAKRLLLTGVLRGEQVAGRFWLLEKPSVESARLRERAEG